MPNTLKPALPEVQLNPNFIYRLESDVVFGVVGLSVTQRNLAIANGELEPPVKLTKSGRARGYTGQQLINIQQRRLAAAEAEATTRREAAAAKPVEPPKKRGRPKKAA